MTPSVNDLYSLKFNLHLVSQTPYTNFCLCCFMFWKIHINGNTPFLQNPLLTITEQSDCKENCILDQKNLRVYYVIGVLVIQSEAQLLYHKVCLSIRHYSRFYYFDFTNNYKVHYPLKKQLLYCEMGLSKLHIIHV